MTNIRNMFPKDTHEWINWINQDKGLYFRKEKILNLLGQQHINHAEVDLGLTQKRATQEGLELATKIVKNFQYPIMDNNSALSKLRANNESVYY